MRHARKEKENEGGGSQTCLLIKKLCSNEQILQRSNRSAGSGPKP